MVGEHEDRHVVGRLVAPPTAPVFVGPRAAHRAEHVATKDPSTDVLESLGRHIVIHTGFAFAGSIHPLEGLRVEEPIEKLGAADAERMLKVLPWSRTEAVDGN
jgi:hypothetical protein